MEQGILNMNVIPEIVLIDSMRLHNINIEQVNIIHGDAKSFSIAAASIIAKVERDYLMERIGSFYPEYGFDHHKRYGTKKHIEAIKRYGLYPLYRRSFTKHFVHEISYVQLSLLNYQPQVL